MEGILVENKNNKLKIFVDEKLSNKKCIMALKYKLDNIFVYAKTRKEIIIEFYSRSFTNKEVLELFDIFESMDNFLITKINCNKQIKEEITILRGNIRNGQVKVCEKSVLLIGTINKGAKIIVNGNLYVLGRLYGDVEIKNKGSKIYCESIYNALVKIGGTYKLYTDEIFDQCIYLDDSEIKNVDYKIGDISNVKSNSSYIW